MSIEFAHYQVCVVELCCLKKKFLSHKLSSVSDNEPWKSILEEFRLMKVIKDWEHLCQKWPDSKNEKQFVENSHINWENFGNFTKWTFQLKGIAKFKR